MRVAVSLVRSCPDLVERWLGCAWLVALGASFFLRALPWLAAVGSGIPWCWFLVALGLVARLAALLRLRGSFGSAAASGWVLPCLCWRGGSFFFVWVCLPLARVLLLLSCVSFALVGFCSFVRVFLCFSLCVAGVLFCVSAPRLGSSLGRVK